MELKCSADSLLNASEEPDVYEEKSIAALRVGQGVQGGQEGQGGQEVPEITLSVPSPQEEDERRATRRVHIVPPGSPQGLLFMYLYILFIFSGMVNWSTN